MNCSSSGWRIHKVMIFLAVGLTASAAIAAPPGANDALYPEIKPYESGHLKVSTLHEIYFECCGNPDGIPVFVLHGGPGGGCSERMRRYFDPNVWNIILHDQRGAGQSRPYAELKDNNTQALVEDIETLRKKLGFEKIVLFGGSWGSTLSLAYAQTYPENVEAMILRGLWTCTQQELEYWYGGEVGRFFPYAYDRLISIIPDGEGTIPERLFEMLTSGDEEIRNKASLAWAGYELKVAYLERSDENVAEVFTRWDPYDFSLIENYYMMNNCFLRPRQLWEDTDRIQEIPTTIINGRYDVICTPGNAWEFSKLLPKAELIIVERAGHSQAEPGITAALVKAVQGEAQRILNGKQFSDVAKQDRFVASQHRYGFWSLLPPLLAITLAIVTRQVFLSLFAGIAVGYIVVKQSVGMGMVASVNACVGVFADPGNTKVILFSIFVGSLIALIQRSGGVDGFVKMVGGLGVVRGRRSAGVFAMIVGMCTFVESSIVCFVTGTVARPIFDKMKISREKLAYVCDTVSAPTCVMIPLNGWGAFVMAQLAILGVMSPVKVLVAAIPLNFYAIFSLIQLFIILITGKDFGPMKKAERRAAETGQLHREGATPMIADDVITLPPEPNTPRRSINMLLPIILMVAMVPVGLALTGLSSLSGGELNISKLFTEGVPYGIWDILGACSGSTAVFYAVLVAVIFCGLFYRMQGIMRVQEYIDVVFKGAAGLVPLGVLIVMAFTIGHLCKTELQTGQFVASVVSDHMEPYMIAPAVFIVSCIIAFSTGTSWGTFAIMLAIGVPLAQGTNAPLELVVAAVLGGGVFGDHCSPISDTTIVSSMASASDHIDHVRTQLPYALTAGTLATIGYLVAGYFMCKPS